ncbi:MULTISPECIES: hypothetical protein [Peribacillus]|uniref:hypothetical protein n=1 Tax=Peribacillus TaxID=2675229 RepID=UPI001F4D7490|nr:MULTISPECIES: hypothetical protein [unclassified Peribacillus]MCK1985191.1 hypothetical protein [Peribacillus sp. Aquil_B1]MCK2007159.1 hypothetical protein [Peribacillus sp. Aquil_B8]
MLFSRKEEVFTIKEFMARKDRNVVASDTFEFKEEVRESLGVMGALGLIPLAMKPLFAASPAFAAGAVTATQASNAMYDKMLHAFDPLIVLIQALAYPVALTVVLGGAIMIMIGDKPKGVSMMSGAGLGYVLVQMTPLVLGILVDAMKVAV